MTRHLAAHYSDVTGQWISKHRTGLTQALLIAGAVLLTAVNFLQFGLDPVTDAAEGADVGALASDAAIEAGDVAGEAGDIAAGAGETAANTQEGLSTLQKIGIGSAAGADGSVLNGLANHNHNLNLNLNPMSVLIGTVTGGVSAGLPVSGIVSGMISGGSNDALQQLWQDRKNLSQFNPAETIGETLLGGAVGGAPALDIPFSSDTAQTVYGSGVGIFVSVFDLVQLFSVSIWQSAQQAHDHR